MFVKELFADYEVECPEWLSHEVLQDNWDGCGHTVEDNVHKWTLITKLHNVLITFDGEEYSFKVFSRKGKLLFIKEINEDSIMMS